MPSILKNKKASHSKNKKMSYFTGKRKLDLSNYQILGLYLPERLQDFDMMTLPLKCDIITESDVMT
jgi:hypothetical protein